ncbi:sigma-70 family RNA polymerase sigma factor [Hydrogenophaga laconesensis]|uniref:sigma-70 family RNA polymerase sigma factor n=1 Tax=Hydrogenophaga laconesensis TaxID=1805971 RepID=UPI001956F7CA
MTRIDPVTATENELHGLFVAGLDGDGAAYHRFLQRLAALLRGYFRRRLQQLPDEVEDLVQETLMAVHTQRQTYRRGEPLTAWVHALARYKLVDLWRRRARHEALNDPLDDELELFAQPDSETGEARRDLGHMLAQLPDHQRLPIQHTKLEGLSVAEAAQLTGMSESAIKVGVHRGLKALARQWKGLA